jgi:hypothetical protein
MTTKRKPAISATQERTTIALDSDALAEATDAAAQGPRPTVELAAVAAPSAGEPAQADELGVTKPRIPVAVPAPVADVPDLAAGDPAVTTQLPIVDLDLGDDGGIPDEVEDEWSLADQPTIQITPPRPKVPRPAYLETGEQAVWPPRPTPAPTPAVRPEEPRAALPPRPNPRPTPTPIPRPPSFTRPPVRPPTTQQRIPSPTGRMPAGAAAAAYSDPRMRRLMALREQREAHAEGQRPPGDNLPVAQLVRQWWSDLLPGLSQALDHQHEARASGVYPIPAHEPSPLAGLGDAFGRLAAVVRDLSGRAQSAAMPALNRLHERAEQAAQALVERIEGPAVRQQAPLLGPGRVAVFFRQGVTLGQAQRVLVGTQVRPMRLIPRRHGLLGMVQPGYEAEAGEQLRQHPYVRDVVYLRYDEQGQALAAR